MPYDKGSACFQKHMETSNISFHTRKQLSHLSPMNLCRASLSALILISVAFSSGTAFCKDVVLPPPDKTGGKPLMAALQERQSIRSYTDKAIPLEILSSLLWAAQGVNREDTDYRTAPTSRNSNEIEIYVILPEAAYRYEPETHTLHTVVPGDLRAFTGTQEFVGRAPLNLVYVVDQSKQPGDFSAQRKLTTACADAGFIGQNVYLFCASSGLGTVFRAMLNADQLHQFLKLPAFKKVLYAQSVGYPSNP